MQGHQLPPPYSRQESQSVTRSSSFQHHILRQLGLLILFPICGQSPAAAATTAEFENNCKCSFEKCSLLTWDPSNLDKGAFFRGSFLGQCSGQLFAAHKIQSFLFEPQEFNENEETQWNFRSSNLILPEAFSKFVKHGREMRNCICGWMPSFVIINLE